MSLEYGKWAEHSWRQVPVLPELDREMRAAGAKNLQVFQKDVSDRHHLNAIVALVPLNNRGERWHLSVSFRRNTNPPKPGNRLPHWSELKEARYLFVPDGLVMACLLPPQDQYVNEHETALHLWESRD